LGWNIGRTNTEVPLRLTEEMARLWNYRSRRMRRDYVLRTRTGQALHVEAKYQWSMPIRQVEVLLAQISRDEWNDTRRDGPKKDLALLLWGAKSQNVRRAALIDESRLLVFDWDDGWKLVAAEELFQGSPDRVHEAFQLLERAPRTWQQNIQLDTHLAAIRRNISVRLIAKTG